MDVSQVVFAMPSVMPYCVMAFRILVLELRCRSLTCEDSRCVARRTCPGREGRSVTSVVRVWSNV